MAISTMLVLGLSDYNEIIYTLLHCYSCAVLYISIVRMCDSPLTLQVRSSFPDATIVRPSKMFGARDRFLNWVAFLSTTGPRLFPIVGDGSTLVQPVHVEDVAEAIVR